MIIEIITNELVDVNTREQTRDVYRFYIYTDSLKMVLDSYRLESKGFRKRSWKSDRLTNYNRLAGYHKQFDAMDRKDVLGLSPSLIEKAMEKFKNKIKWNIE